MNTDSLADALEREHHEIDQGLAAYSADPGDRQALARASAALRRHIYLEEEFLFPLLGEAQPGLRAPVFVMLREHAQIWDALDALDAQEHDAHTPHSPAAATLLKQLTVQLLHHNTKEEKILYPQADQLLEPAAADRLRQFLSSAQPPEGWVCVKARPAPSGA